MRRVGIAGFACALPILGLLVPQVASASTSLGGGAIGMPRVSGPARPATPAAGATRFVSYNGVRLAVPVAWPVIDLRLHPSACVRLDRAALYLGAPGSQSDCPAHAVGRGDTVWLKPASVGHFDPLKSQSGTVGALAAHVGVDSVGHGKQAQLDNQGVAVEATWGADSSSIDRVLASVVSSSASSTPTPAPSSRPASAPAPVGVAPAATQPLSPAALTPAATGGAHYGGMGFDTCAAPSVSAMRAWLHSPYRAVGVYIGGSMRACGDGNLSASWVSAVHAMGWSMIPTYVGPQAPCVNQSGVATISATGASAQGTANASDAVSRARSFGMGPGTPIYYDMEGYNPSGSCSRTVTTFLSAWTSQLHRLGYTSGAYGGPGSLMTDMSRLLAARASFAAPDNVWFAHWNGARTSMDQSSYPGFPNTYWNQHQRVHQYAGNIYASYGGVTIGIDADWVDGGVAGTPARAATPPASRAPAAIFSPGDFTGDGHADIVGTTLAGAMYLYHGNGVGGFSGGGSKIGGGWFFSKVLSPGDFTGDRRADVIGIAPSGDMYIYRGNGLGGFQAGRQWIGGGWGTFSKVFSPGDFTGDGRADVIGIAPSGDMYIYRGNGLGGFQAGRQWIGGGWGIFSKVFSPRDFTGDRRTDVIGITPAGAMYLYRGNGRGGFAGGGTKIGAGWGGFCKVFSPGDYTGDGRTDILGVSSAGALYLYRGNGLGGFAGVGTKIGGGWGAFCK